jgi:hypothetical protein
MARHCRLEFDCLSILDLQTCWTNKFLCEISYESSVLSIDVRLCVEHVLSIDGKTRLLFD